LVLEREQHTVLFKLLRDRLTWLDLERSTQLFGNNSKRSTFGVYLRAKTFEVDVVFAPTAIFSGVYYEAYDNQNVTKKIQIIRPYSYYQRKLGVPTDKTGGAPRVGSAISPFANAPPIYFRFVRLNLVTILSQRVTNISQFLIDP